MYVVRCLGSHGCQENYKTLEDRKNCECYVSRKIQEINFVLSKWSLFLSFSSLYFFKVYYFSFAFLIINSTTKWQRTHINKTSNINKLITISSWRNQDKCHIEFFEKLFNLDLSSHFFHKVTFASFRCLYSHKT